MKSYLKQVPIILSTAALQYRCYVINIYSKTNVMSTDLKQLKAMYTAFSIAYVDNSHKTFYHIFIQANCYFIRGQMNIITRNIHHKSSYLLPYTHAYLLYFLINAFYSVDSITIMYKMWHHNVFSF